MQLPEGGRRQAAIMFTDMVGYTSMMQRNEPLAMELLEEHRRIVRPSIAKHGGREVKTMGDAFMVEFPGALEAVRCAVEVQDALHARNLRSAPENQLVIRVGVHLGGVIYAEDGGDVYGNSVNIASRVEPLADPGGVCVTDSVYDVVKSSPDLRFENLGEHDLKNVEVPIGIYRAVLPWERPGSERAPSQSLRPRELQPSPLVDRESERKRLEAALASVASKEDSASHVVFISGEAGIGKSRLVDWLIKEAMKLGAGAARGHCQADFSVAYFPISEAFGRYLSEHRGGSRGESVSLVNWLRTSTKASMGYDPGLGLNQIMEGTVRLLGRLSTRGVFLLCLEDVHWADRSTLALLQYIGRNVSDMKVMVVCTYRPEDLQGEPGVPHPLTETMSLMTREIQVLKVELGRMDTTSIVELVAPTLGSTGQEFQSWVVRESGGNPLYAVEYARMMKEDLPKHGPEEGFSELPESVHGVIQRRLARLGPDERRLVNCGALIGEKFDPRLVSEALGLEYLSTLERLDEVFHDSRILREEVEGSSVSSFRFDHAKIREVVVKDLSHGLKRELHNRIFQALLRSSPDSAEEIAFHCKEAGDLGQVPKYAVAAGDRARLKYANAEAVEYYGWALDALESQGKRDTDLTMETLLSRAQSYMFLAKYEQALRDARAVLAEATETTIRIQAIRICADCCFELGRFTESLEYCESDEARRYGQGNAEGLKIDRTRAIVTGYRGNSPAAIEELDRIIAGFKGLGERREAAETLLSKREFLFTMFDAKGAKQSALEAKSIYTDLEYLEGEMRSSWALAGDCLFKGDVPGGDENYGRAAELGEKLGLHGTLVWLYLYWGLLHEGAADYQTALQLSLKALKSAGFSETPYGETAVLVSLARLYARMDNPSASRDAYSKMNSLFEEQSKDTSLTLQAAVRRSRGFYHGIHGEFKEADSEYAASLELIRTGPLGPLHEAHTRLEYGEFLIAQGRRAEYDTQLSQALGIFEKFGNLSGVTRVKEMRTKAGLDRDQDT